MLLHTQLGLYCPEGDFYIDPSGPVDHAIITHAHSDHARRGSKQYYCVHSGADLLRVRLGRSITVHSVAYSETFSLGRMQISFHPAGHILGSSQVRLQSGGEVWVVSGDYKREADETCEPFEPVPCDVFVTEATFGTPSYTWKKDRDHRTEILSWWDANRKEGKNSILFAYSLGKAQRILGLLADSGNSVYCPRSVIELSACYRAQGIRLAPMLELEEISTPLKGALILAPQSILQSEQCSLLEPFETAFASGWMARPNFRFSSAQTGFVLSDHADWEDLLRTVKESQARRIYVQHRGKGALVRELQKLGYWAAPVQELKKETHQYSLF